MKRVALADALIELRTGPFGSVLHKADYVEGGIPLVNPMHIVGGKIVPDGSYSITSAKAAELQRYMLFPGHIVVGRRGEMGRCAVVENNLGTALCGTGSMILIPDRDKLDPRYAVHLIRSGPGRAFLENAASGVTMLNINPSAVASLEIPLPPLEEQKRIAAILDQADVLRSLRRRALDRLNTLGQAIFHEMFGDLVANPKALPRRAIGDVIEGFETGKNIAEDPDESATNGARVLKVSAVTSGTFKPWESKPLPEDYVPPPSHYVKDGDLLFSRANTEQLIGATAVVTGGRDNLVLPDKLWRFRWRSPSEVDLRFIQGLFRSSAFRDEIRKRSSGTSGSMKNIGQAKVLAIEFGCPDIEAQARYRTVVTEIDTRLQQVSVSANHAQTLFASLQHRVFRGEL